MKSQIIHITNPFNPTDGLERCYVDGPFTIREWLTCWKGPEFTDFAIPTVCQVDGLAIMRKDWDTLEIQPGSTVVFASLPGDAVTIVIAVIALVVSIAAILLMPDPRLPGENQEGDTVNNLRGQFNRLRLGEPIESHYGQVTAWPSYAAPPYSRYIGNDQFQYSFYCLGQGQYAIAGTFYDDTPTVAFEDVEIEIIPPGEEVTLFNSKVTTAAEVTGLEILGTNDEAYSGLLGPYVLSGPGVLVNKIEVDIVAPEGLYEMDEDDPGDMDSVTVHPFVEVQKINNDGDALSGWNRIIDEHISDTTNTPQRFTFEAEVVLGRYQIRCGRGDETSDDTGTADKLIWESAKGYSPNEATYPGKTMIAVKVKASNALNNNSAKRFNVKCTRELPKWDGTVWSDPIATRNPVWACLDVFRARYGARLTDEYIDLETFRELAADLEETEDWLDFTFDTRLVIWDAAKLCLSVCNATPLPQGSRYSVVRDVPALLPAAIFNQHNIVQGSLTKALDLFKFNDYDSVEVEYIDPNTWKPEQVIAALPGRTRDNPEQIKLPGCTSRGRAYRWGMRFRANREKRRKTVKFQTGLEGQIPSYMDLVSITHPTLKMGFAGLIVSYDSEDKLLTLSDAVAFEPGMAHSVLFRGKDGAAMGNPIGCIAGDAPNKLILATDPAEEFDFSENQLPPFYAFGVSNLWSFLGKVVNMEPGEGDTVTITLINYSRDVYKYDGATIPELPEPTYIGTPVVPIITFVTLANLNSTFDGNGTAVWSLAPGALYYRIQISHDGGASWSPDLANPISPTHNLTLSIGANKVRVCGVSSTGHGAWVTSNTINGATVVPFSTLTESGQAELTEGGENVLDENAP